MRDENRTLRQEQIEKAAYRVLEEHGYAGTSMLKIARQARASNETLYNWYGDKAGLFRSLVARNAAEVKALLEEGLAHDAPPLDTLAMLGPKLLTLLLSRRAIALNRAAAADPTGELGAAISEAGRETVAPLIGKVLEHARTGGILAFSDTRDAVELYLNLLIGDLQIRRAIGREAEPGPDFITARAETALTRLSRLLAP